MRRLSIHDIQQSASPRLQLVVGESSDADLLARLRRGDREATARLYDRFHRDINRVVWKLLGGDADHNDLVHDIFIKVSSQIARVREPDKLANWVVAVAVNTVYKEIRKRKVRRLFLRQAPRDPTTRGADVEGRDLLRRVYGVLDHLSARERMAFSLRFLDERTLPEVAELCGWSLATTKRRLDRAKTEFGRLAGSDRDLARRLGIPDKGGRS